MVLHCLALEVKLIVVVGEGREGNLEGVNPVLRTPTPSWAHSILGGRVE